MASHREPEEPALKVVIQAGNALRLRPEELVRRKGSRYGQKQRGRLLDATKVYVCNNTESA